MACLCVSVYMVYVCVSRLENILKMFGLNQSCSIAHISGALSESQEALIFGVFSTSQQPVLPESACGEHINYALTTTACKSLLACMLLGVVGEEVVRRGGGGGGGGAMTVNELTSACSPHSGTEASCLKPMYAIFWTLESELRCPQSTGSSTRVVHELGPSR